MIQYLSSRIVVGVKTRSPYLLTSYSCISRMTENFVPVVLLLPVIQWVGWLADSTCGTGTRHRPFRRIFDRLLGNHHHHGDATCAVSLHHKTGQCGQLWFWGRLLDHVVSLHGFHHFKFTHLGRLVASHRRHSKSVIIPSWLRIVKQWNHGSGLWVFNEQTRRFVWHAFDDQKCSSTDFALEMSIARTSHERWIVGFSLWQLHYGRWE